MNVQANPSRCQMILRRKVKGKASRKEDRKNIAANLGFSHHDVLPSTDGWRLPVPEARDSACSALCAQLTICWVDCRGRRINPFHSTDNRANRHHIPLVWALSGGGMVIANQQQQDGPAHCGWVGEGNKPTISGLCSAFGRNCPRNPRDIELVR